MKQEQKTHVSADALIQLLKGARSIRWQLALGVLMSLVLVVCALVIPTLSLSGPCVTIRKFSRIPLLIEDLISYGTLSEQMASFLRACVKAKLNIMVSGGTGSGKTTTLNVLSSFIPSDERIVTIEDAAELRLEQPHVVTLESRPPNIEGKGAAITPP